jgi:spore maturation protein SpmB
MASLLLDHSHEELMAGIVDILLQSGKSALELSLYILLPIMVVMMALMKLLEAKGVLAFVAGLLTPVLKPFGIPGIGVFAILQSLLISFAAPAATLSIMEKDGTSTRKIAATLAMVLTISQANVVFPLLTVGLNLWMTFLTSLIGGIVASTLTYYYFARSVDTEVSRPVDKIVSPDSRRKGILGILVEGGQEGVQLALRSIPILVLTICLVNILKATGVISFFEWSLTPALNKMHLPGIAVLPVATKFLAGGTAMMGITINLVKEGGMTSVELNRIAGLVINPLDLVGVAVLISAGPRVASIAKPAILGAAVGILVRTILHFIIFS